MNIYSANGELVLSVTPSGSSQRTRKIMGDNSLTLIFESTDFIEIPLYSYIDYEGERYTLWRPEDFTKNGDRIWEYAVKFGGWQEFLKTRMFKFLSAVPHELKFPITAKPDALVQILVDNLNENSSGWTKGEVIDATEKTLSFNYEYCYDALNRIAEEFSTEWEIQGKTIHLRKVEKNKNNPVPLKYGKDNGLRPGIVRKVKKEKAPVTKLYVQGGERNINRSAYGSKSLLLPTDRTLQYEGRTYRTDASGVFITRADRTLTVYNEDGFDATHIYPSRVGTVSEVITVDAEQNFYDFKDSSIPEDLNFSDCRIPGEKATVIFQTGVLAGKEFDIEQTDDDLTGYVHAERRFKLVPLDEDGTVYPNENCKPHVGDQYAVFNISLPQAYVRDDATQTGASWDMFREAVKYMYENEDELFTITGELSSLFAKENWLDIGGRIVPGGYIAFSDDRFMQEATLIRITGIAEPLEQPWKATLELSNVSIAGNILTGLSKLEAEEVVIESKTKELRRYMSRSWRDAIETLHMVENSLLENFTGAINPIAIQSMAILVGDKNLQFRFVNSKTNPQRVEHVVTFNNTTKILYAPAGIIQHRTLGISDVSSAHKASEYKYWNIPAYTSPPLDDAKAYYLYAKVSQTGTFVLSETAKAMNADAGYYYLWVGQINSAYDGVRTDFLTMYGFTEITPGQITTDVLRDPDAKLVINLADATITAQNGATIRGNLRIEAGSSGLENLDEWPDFTDDLDNTIKNINQSVTDLENYVDNSFLDGVLSEAEAIGIRDHMKIVKEEVDSLYTQLNSNSYLTGVRKTELATAYATFGTKYAALNTAITNAIDEEGEFATAAEMNAVSTAYENFKNAIGDFYEKAQNAQEAIDCYLATKTVKLYQQEMAGKKKEVDATYNEVYNDTKLTNTTANGNAKTALQTAYNNFNTAHTALASTINTALNDNIVNANELSDVEGKYETFCTRAGEFTTAATKAQKEIVNASVDNLENYMNEAFYDGVITESEARGIKEHIEIVQEEVNSLYTELYNNSFLSGTPKTNLATAKTNFNSAFTALSNVITAAISDGFATDKEKADVSAAFTAFKTQLNAFYTAAQNAQEAIDSYLKTK
ncbi:MAG: hypothetical protein MdMp024_0523 [Bacteroidales bacterium]